MQLNPARGRKPAIAPDVPAPPALGLCSSTPRGDGNQINCIINQPKRMVEVYAAQPREGTETCINTNPAAIPLKRVYAAQPREGTETRLRKLKQIYLEHGLCSSTPRGDGNSSSSTGYSASVTTLVYAAQPREGTETQSLNRLNPNSRLYGLCSSTPRGDGNVNYVPRGRPISLEWFMQLNPARGRKPFHPVSD